MSDRDLVTVGPFTKGVNNRLKDHALTAEMLRSAVNVQIDDAGKLSMRKGFEQVHACAGHSGFGCGSGILFAEENSLKLFNPDTAAVTVLRSDLAAAQPVAYISVNGDVYYSNGSVTGKVVDGVSKEWGVEPPSGVPSLAAMTGALPAGIYQVALTHEHADGEESGAGLVATITLNDGQGISIAKILAPVSSEVTKVNIFCSEANGEILYRVAQLNVGVPSFQLLTASYVGRQLRTQFMSRPMPGKVLAYVGGRIFYAIGKFVFYTEPLAYGLCRLSRNFLMFAEDVTIMAGVADGLYIVADQTYFYSNTDPDAFVPRAVLPYGGAFGSAEKLPTQADSWVWYSDRGLVVAANSGQITNLQEDQLSLDAATSGASHYLEQDGQKQVISLSTPKGYSTSAATQGFVDMEVRRKGT